MVFSQLGCFQLICDPPYRRAFTTAIYPPDNRLQVYTPVGIIVLRLLPPISASKACFLVPLSTVSRDIPSSWRSFAAMNKFRWLMLGQESDGGSPGHYLGIVAGFRQHPSLTKSISLEYLAFESTGLLFRVFLLKRWLELMESG